MQRTFVLDKNRKPLMPCHPARARVLIKRGKARVYRLQPFTILLTEREGGVTQLIEQKFDPGSRTTGIALVATFEKRGRTVVFGANANRRFANEADKSRLLSTKDELSDDLDVTKRFAIHWLRAFAEPEQGSG